MFCMFPLFTLFLRYQKFFTLKENYVRRSCSYDRLILSWLTYYFRSSTIVSIVYCKYSAPSRQNLDVFWDFEFSWRLLLSLSSSSSSSARASSAFMTISCHPSRSCNKAGKSFERHPVSLQSWSMLVIAGWLCADRKWTITWWGKKN